MTHQTSPRLPSRREFAAGVAATAFAATSVHIAAAQDDTQEGALGRFRAILSGQGAPPTQGGRCPALGVAIDGPGIATHLGHFTTIQDHCIDPSGADPMAFTDGVYTFTAEDGSTIAGRYNGLLSPTETTAMDNVFLLEGRFTIDTGTGRFEGATGGGGADGLQDLTTGQATLVLDGVIAYSGLTVEATQATPVG